MFSSFSRMSKPYSPGIAEDNYSEIMSSVLRWVGVDLIGHVWKQIPISKLHLADTDVT